MLLPPLTHKFLHFSVNFARLRLFRERSVFTVVVTGVCSATPLTHVFRHFRGSFCRLCLFRKRLEIKGVVKSFELGIYVRVHSTHTHMRTHTHVHAHAHTTHTHTHKHMNTHTHTHVRVDTHAHTYISALFHNLRLCVGFRAWGVGLWFGVVLRGHGVNGMHAY